MILSTKLNHPLRLPLAGEVHARPFVYMGGPVAVDDDRNPVSVPALRPFTPVEKQRHEAAAGRKKLRQELEQRFGALREISSVKVCR